MKSNNMKIPPLSQLLKQKHDYEVHKKKLQKIMSDRKGHLQESKELIPRRCNQNYQRKYNTKSLEIAKANSIMVKKIQKAKPSVNFKSDLDARKASESRASLSLNSRSKIFEQERENFRMRARVQSMHSSLNKDSLMKDYQRSMQIKNRIMHFKTQPNNKVTLKANRYLSSSKVTIDKSKLSREDSLPKIARGREGISAQKLTKELITMKMKRVGTNIASYYKKEEIIRNKVLGNNKLFKMARQQRSKAVSMLQANGNKSKNEVESAVFATELSKPLK